MITTIEWAIVKVRRYDVRMLVRRGKCEVADFVAGVARPDQIKIRALIDKCVESTNGPIGRIDEKVKRLTPQIWELKGGQVRILFFLDGPGRMILTNGFMKKGKRTPRNQIERAERLRILYLEEAK